MLPSLVIQQLQQIEAVLREHGHWQANPPDAQAFNSTQPFCLDTLQPLEWLQWVLLPRLQALMTANAPLPTNFAVAPYYEVALPPDTPGYSALVTTLTRLDALFSEPAV